jgi:NAD-dependent deacetylase
VTLVTQNIDDLHERAGAPDVIHMHGSLVEALCTSCDAVRDWRGPMTLDSRCESCGGIGVIRPNVVWFGEMPYHMDRIETAMASAQLFVSIGTSGSVYPAAGYVAIARELGIHTVELNLEPSDNAALFDDGRYGPATEVVAAWVDEVLGKAETKTPPR